MPHPQSVLRAPDGRQVQLNVLGCVWSGEFPENSVSAIRECLRAPVARATININLLRGGDCLVTRGSHGQVCDDRWPLLSEVVDLVRSERSSTLLELDARDVDPWPWSRAQELARMLEPVRDRVVVVSRADWNLRRIAYVDPRIRLGFEPTLHLDWVPADVTPDELPGEVGAYGYLDRHPLARTRTEPTSDYLWDRVHALSRLVPNVSEMRFRYSLFEHMQSDGLGDTTHRLRRAGIQVDLWTLDANTPDWQARVNNAVWAGADIITTRTPQQLAKARIR